MNYLHIFSSFSTHRFEESITFYRDVLGLEVEVRGERFLHVDLGEGTTIVIYHKPDHQPADYTVLNIQCTDIKMQVEALTAKGIAFGQYEAFQTDAQGISWDDQGSHLAWFKDPGGNIVALIEH